MPSVPAPTACRRCDGEGYVNVDRRLESAPIRNGAIYLYKRCPDCQCPCGREAAMVGQRLGEQCLDEIDEDTRLRRKESAR